MNALPEALDASLRPAIDGPVFFRGDSGLTEEVAGFNALTVHEPDIVVGVTSEADVVASVRFATEHSLPVYVQATGHGAYSRIDSGMLVITRRMNTLSIDADSHIATIGAGLSWKTVVAQAAELGLAPITGSSPGVGAVGFLLGGGLGPLSRTYGVAADWVRSFRAVTADGNAVTASAEENSELFWALRGGKGGLGVVTEVQVELVPLTGVYGGGLFFAAGHIEQAFRAWADWSRTVPDSVTSSVAVLRLPDMEDVPPPLRGRLVLHVRFAFVGDPDASSEQRAVEAERILAPLRESAPIYLDMIGDLPAADIGHIHNDPEGPMPVWDHGMFLTTIDQEFVTALLAIVGDGTDVPLILAEVRHLGGAIHRVPDGGNAVGGRGSGYALTLIGAPVPELFEHVLPSIANGITAAIMPWRHAETNINFAGRIRSHEHFTGSWSTETFDRLAAARASWDPNGVFAYGPPKSIAADPVPDPA